MGVQDSLFVKIWDLAISRSLNYLLYSVIIKVTHDATAKKCEKQDLDQPKRCAAPVCWSKFTTDPLT